MQKVPSNVLVADLEAALKRSDGYIMGAYGQNPRTGSLNLSDTAVKSSWKPTGWYYTQYDGNSKQKEKALYWRSHATRVWDCAGMAEGIYQLHTGVCVDTKARYIYSQWCDPKGSGTIPASYRVPGAAMFWGESAASIHHIGYLYKPVNESNPSGDWYIIEARGVIYGVVLTKLSSRKPNYWGLMTKYFDYSNTTPDYTPVKLNLGDRLLKNGCDGDDVKELQTNLIRLGYDCGAWGADGDFGDATEMAVRAFQKANDLVVDGKFGPKSLEAMEKLIGELEVTVESPKKVRIVGGNCYVRQGPGTNYDQRGVAFEGEQLPFGGKIDDESKWISVIYKDSEGWVSPKYGKLEK